ncbi:MAG: AtpZ/AtpI family protein [Planctomycetota bacterium]
MNEPTPPRRDSDARTPLRGLNRMLDYAQVGYYFIGAFLGSAGLGWLIDRWLGTLPWGVIVGCLVGLASGGWMTLRELERMSRRRDGDQ